MANKSNLNPVISIILWIVGGIIAYKVLIGLLGFVMNAIVPIAVLAGIGYVLYRANGGRALMGGKKTLQ
jgi:hypothetical protein